MRNVKLINLFIYFFIFTTLLVIEDPLSLYPFNLNGHLNEKGYEAVGNTVYDYI